MQERSRVRWQIGLGITGLVLAAVWFWLRASADIVSTGPTAAIVPRSGLVTAIDGSTITLESVDGAFSITIDETTVIRHSTGGAFDPIPKTEIQPGQLAVITGEVPGATGPVDAIDLVDLGSAQ